MEEATGHGDLSGFEKEGNRTAIYRKIPPQQGEGNVCMRRMRSTIILIRYKV